VALRGFLSRLLALRLALRLFICWLLLFGAAAVELVSVVVVLLSSSGLGNWRLLALQELALRALVLLRSQLGSLLQLLLLFLLHRPSQILCQQLLESFRLAGGQRLVVKAWLFLRLRQV
jgi:hypothetical protein